LPPLDVNIQQTRQHLLHPRANDHHPGIQQAVAFILAERSADPGTAAARKCLQQIHTIASLNCSVASALRGNRPATGRRWVPKTSVPSCDLLILVDQASEQAGASHLGWWYSGSVCGPVGWSLTECAVWPMSVVVVEVGLQDCSQVVTAENEDSVGALATDRADPPFGDGVGAGRAYRRANDLYLFRGEYGIETGDELGVAITNQETQLFDPIAKVP
jgi:hypothetical protein